MSCAMCSQPIQALYYEAGGQVVCASCRGKLASDTGRAGRGGRLTRAAGLGFLAAVVGAVVYYAIRAATGYELGIVAILVGYGVGRAVSIGSGHRGGRGYQLLAVGLTYFAIATTYVPMARESMNEKIAAKDSIAARADSGSAAAPATTAASEKMGVGGFLIAVAALIAFCAVLPVLVGISNPIGILILIFGLLQAWRMNRHVELSVTGPYRLAPVPGAAGA
jgi:hypothetical protein